MYFSETNQKLADGSGFIYVNDNNNFLITNWHNVTGLDPTTHKPLGAHGGTPDMLKLKLLVQTKPFIKWKSFGISLYENKEKQWIEHPVHKEKVDVIALKITTSILDDSLVRPINNNEFENFKLQVSDDVFILGFPYRLKGGGNFPIWKRGSVATEPDLELDGLPKLLVDTASRPGMSGSLVIYRRTGLHGLDNGMPTDETIIGNIQGFVGIYSGRIQGKSSHDAQLGIVWKASVIDEIIKSSE
ncbi:MAG: hypothetical protein CL840_08950 [Crocinitomicaceae bacterium]|nr:hypothetical protein [Crocinitomicaceae bacterium]